MIHPGEPVRLKNIEGVPESARGLLGRVARRIKRSDGSTDLAVQLQLKGIVVVPESAVYDANVIH
jgi:hypothetical protein